MESFNGAQYLCIDLANSYGLDKQTFQSRIQWVKDNILNDINNAERFAYDGKCDDPVLFIKGIRAIKEAKKGKPIGHLVEFDATTSGPQIMSALTACETGGIITNLIDPTTRYDCYTSVYSEMQNRLPHLSNDVSRKQVKDVVMTSSYGSSFEPRNLFGDKTPELRCFYSTMNDLLPGAWNLRNTLIDAWQPFALEHSYVMPDGFNAKIKVMDKEKIKVEVDELDHHKFTHIIEVNKGCESYVSLAGNAVHSHDGMLVRESHRRCNYNKKILNQAKYYIENILLTREKPTEFSRDFISLVHIDSNLDKMDTSNLYKLLRIIKICEKYNPFELLTIHDAFKTHACNMNMVRFWYKELLAELAESNVMEDILFQITGQQHNIKVGNQDELAKSIRYSNYALC